MPSSSSVGCEIDRAAGRLERDRELLAERLVRRDRDDPPSEHPGEIVARDARSDDSSLVASSATGSAGTPGSRSGGDQRRAVAPERPKRSLLAGLIEVHQVRGCRRPRSRRSTDRGRGRRRRGAAAGCSGRPRARTSATARELVVRPRRRRRERDRARARADTFHCTVWPNRWIRMNTASSMSRS